MTKTDYSFSATSRIASAKWVAARFGKGYDWFSRARPKLEADGFPKRDDLLGGWIKDDVDAWIERRRKIGDASDHVSDLDIKIDDL